MLTAAELTRIEKRNEDAKSLLFHPPAELDREALVETLRDLGDGAAGFIDNPKAPGQTARLEAFLRTVAALARTPRA